MPKISHMPLLRAFIQFLFLFFSLAITASLQFLRLFNILFKRKKQFLNPFKYTHEDVFKSKYEFIKVQGFNIVEYQCTTDDHANVCLWRIVPDSTHQQNINSDTDQEGPSKKNYTSSKKPILIQHGLFDCSMSWFFHQQPQQIPLYRLKTLPYMLATQGYDIWLGNNRGTRFSSPTTNHQPDENYSLDHLAEYDIPCLIDFILTTTSSNKLTYIGHSQGSTQFLTALEIKPELGDKIEVFFGLGPLISMQHLNNHVILQLCDKLKIMEILKFIGFKTIFCVPVWISKLSGFLIYNSTLFSKSIHYFVQNLCGTNRSTPKINLNRFGIIMSHQPGGSSINNVHHWIQIYRKGTMSKFDYGQKINKQKYGQNHSNPPVYTHDTLKDMEFEFHLFRGQADGVIRDGDWDYLVSKLNLEKLTVYNLEDYAHLDYVWCEDAYEDIYVKILRVVSNRDRDRDNDSEEMYEKVDLSLEHTNASETEILVKNL